MIWDALCKNYSDGGVNSILPSAVCHVKSLISFQNVNHFCQIFGMVQFQYQIRFLGYKGVVSVDTRLEGIQMCLRPSMRKFTVPWRDGAEIEIASAFGNPKTPHLNRYSTRLAPHFNTQHSIGPLSWYWRIVVHPDKHS